MMGFRKQDEVLMQRRIDAIEDKLDRKQRRLSDRLAGRLCTVYVNRELIERHAK